MRYIRRGFASVNTTVLLLVVSMWLVGCQKTVDKQSVSFPEVSQSSVKGTDVRYGRYRIYQSDLAVRWTFKLDRFTGEISQLVQTKDESISWEPMLILHPEVVSQPTLPRFELFTSKLAVRFTYIIDTYTGRTWQLVSSKNNQKLNSETYLWEPFN